MRYFNRVEQFFFQLYEENLLEKMTGIQEIRQAARQTQFLLNCYCIAQLSISIEQQDVVGRPTNAKRTMAELTNRSASKATQQRRYKIWLFFVLHKRGNDYLVVEL